MSCGIIVYGVDYIRSKVTNIKQWVQMNPGIQFIIVTTLLTDTEAERVAIEDIITELNTELVGLIPVTILYIDEPIVKWYKIELQRLKLPIHFLSDIIRWFGLYAINQQKGGHVFLLEADMDQIEHVFFIPEYQNINYLTTFCQCIEMYINIGLNKIFLLVILNIIWQTQI